MIAIEALQCPATGAPLVHSGSGWLQTNDGEHRYPIIDGVPILIAGSRSLFSPEMYIRRKPEPPARPSLLRRLRVWVVPPTGRNRAAARNLARLATLVQSDAHRRSRILVIGGGDIGEGVSQLIGRGDMELVETDVYLGRQTAVVCDGHDLPFADGAFDAVVCQAVLEHVIDPYRVVSEIERVLKPSGLIYSEIPFMQQVHEGAYDFTRFTHLGHRRLLRRFDEIASGPTGGPGMALAWSWRYFAMSWAGSSPALRVILDALVTLLSFWLIYLDDVLGERPAALDAASGTYFLGRLRSAPVPDRDVIAGYRGAQPSPDRV
jgi:SAM-dependent methyltransferase